MQIKTFTAPTIGEAMERVRLEIGAEAVIVSARQDKGAAEVTAAADDDAPAGGEEQTGPRTPGEPRRVPWLKKNKRSTDMVLDPSDRVRQALTFHGAPRALANRLVRGVSALGEDGADRGDTSDAFQSVIEDAFAFAPLDGILEKTVIFFGPPGCGKTVTVAKLATRHALNKGTAPGLITADVQRAGGIEQLEGFARILEADLKVVASPGGLGEAAAKGWTGGGLFIDTPGTNPFSPSDMSFLADMIDAADALPVLILPAGADVEETADAAAAFSAIGAKQLIVSRTDAVRRQGAALAAADAGNLEFLGLGTSTQIADGITPATPRLLARLFLPEIDQTHDTWPGQEKETP